MLKSLLCGCKLFSSGNKGWAGALAYVFWWVPGTRYKTLQSTGRTLQAPVVQKVNSAIRWINLYQCITQLVSLILIRWIVIYPVDSAIQCLNNRGQGPVVRTPVSANPGLNFNPGFFFFLSKALSRIIFSILFKISNHHIEGKEN